MRFEDKSGSFRRQYPRRDFSRKIGVLCDGSYFVCDSREIGEGGMSIRSEYILTEGHQVVLSFQVPNGSFVFLRGTIVSTQKKQGDDTVTHGLSFNEIDFSIKRQIRSYVSARADAS